MDSERQCLGHQCGSPGEHSSALRGNNVRPVAEFQYEVEELKSEVTLGTGYPGSAYVPNVRLCMRRGWRGVTGKVFTVP